MSVATRLQVRRRAAIAAGAAAVLVACTLLVAWHRAVVVHGTCAEHGDEIHLEQPEPGPAPIEPGHAALFAGSVAVEGDSHCTLLTTTPGADPAHRDIDVAHVPLATSATGSAPSGAEAAVALLRLAPKTSPPA